MLGKVVNTLNPSTGRGGGAAEADRVLGQPALCNETYCKGEKKKIK